MSEENVEIVRQLNDAFRVGDWDTALEPYDEEVELDVTRLPAGDVYHGPEGVREFFTHWITAWESFEVERLDLIDAGDVVIMISQITGVGKSSGAQVKMRSADVFYIENGKIARHVAYPDAAEALASFGLRR